MLLDTHVWIWAANGGGKLGAKTRRRLSRPGSTDRLAISTASIFEVAALHTAGRLSLTLPVERWIRESIDIGSLQLFDVDRDIALDAGQIPASALPDPIDRWLVSTASEHDLPLLTSDRKILEYAARTARVRALDASR